MDKLEVCIAQHGLQAQELIGQAILLRDICLLPNFSFSPPVSETIKELLEMEERFGRPAYGPPFVTSIQLFAKPQIFLPTASNINQSVIEALFELGLQLCPFLRELYEYEVEKEYILVQIQDFTQDRFITWFKKQFLNAEYFCEPVDEDMEEYRLTIEGNKCLIKREEYIEFILSEIIPKLFGSNPENKVFFCPMNDGDHNENIAFVPYFVIGQSCLLFLVKEWIL